MATVVAAERLPGPLKETASSPPYMLGNFPRVEWLFDRVETVAGQTGAAPSAERLDQPERLGTLMPFPRLGEVTSYSIDKDRRGGDLQL